MKRQRTEVKSQMTRLYVDKFIRKVIAMLSYQLIILSTYHLINLSPYQPINLSTFIYGADFKLREVKPRIMTVGSLQLNDRIFFRFDPIIYAPNLRLKIFTLDGVSVREILYTNDGSGEIFWEGKNADGNFVLPGVYIYQIETGKKVVNGTVVVAR